MERLIYIVAFEDMAHRERAWAQFRSDPVWQKVKSESEANGLLVRRVFNTLLSPTDYSPWQ